jgi:cobalt-zinc-cadmium resistance protein CzcA
MLRRVIRFALRQRVLILGATLLLVVLGVRAYLQLPVEAFPDVEDIHVKVIAQWPGHAAEEMERSVSLPIERQLNGLPNLTSMRSRSIFGLTDVTLTFADGTNDYFAREQILEQLQTVSLPAGVTPSLEALANSLGEIYRYTLEGPAPLLKRRELQDWVLEPQFRSVPGVADVNAFGGLIKQYQIDLDPARLRAYNVTLLQVEQAVGNANANTGGGYIEHGSEKQVVRGEGLFHGIDDIAGVVVAEHNGVPVRVRDLGSVSVGSAPREGIVARDTSDDCVEAIVVMRKGLNAIEVLKGVRAKADEIRSTLLPKDVRMVTTYDRADLVYETVRTVRENLVMGAVLVLLVLMLFLGDWRSAVIVGVVIPLSLLAAFIVMHLGNVSANLISLGSVDFGIIVDSAVVLVETFLVRLALERPADDLAKREVLANAAQGMGRPILFSKAILITAFLPIFTFQRVEKRIFSPMAYTLSFALLASVMLSLTLIPVLSSYFMKTGGEHGETRATRLLRRAFAPLLDVAIRRRRLLIGVASALLIGTLGLATTIGTEFLPELDEGNIWLRVTMPTGISLRAAKVVERRVRDIVSSFPQVRQVITQLGRPDDGTDSKGANNLELYLDLKPRHQWGPIHDKDTLIRQLTERLGAIPGIDLNFSQYIKDNVEEALSGVTGELVVKIFGPDLHTLEETANRVQDVLSGVRGVADLAVEKQFGQPQLRFVTDRSAIARYGLNVSDVNDAIETAIGGKAVTQLYEGSRSFDVVVRFQNAARDNLQALSALPIATPDGGTVPMASVAHIITDEGAARVAREANERRIAVKCSVRGRDQGGFVAEGQRLVAQRVPLPPGYRITWGGQFENQRRAAARLALIVPASIILIFILLFSAFGSTKYASLILANLPFALIGGIVTLWARHINLSVSAAVGFIALFGISVQNGVILVSEFNRLREAGLPVDEAVRRGTLDRLRPVVMTALMAALGLLPAALSHRVGAETTRPFASVIIGGLATSTLLTLVLLPALYKQFHEEPHLDLAR